jgi:hypothetical protein
MLVASPIELFSDEVNYTAPRYLTFNITLPLLKLCLPFCSQIYATCFNFLKGGNQHTKILSVVVHHACHHPLDSPVHGLELKDGIK